VTQHNRDDQRMRRPVPLRQRAVTRNIPALVCECAREPAPQSASYAVNISPRKIWGKEEERDHDAGQQVAEDKLQEAQLPVNASAGVQQWSECGSADTIDRLMGHQARSPTQEVSRRVVWPRRKSPKPVYGGQIGG